MQIPVVAPADEVLALRVRFLESLVAGLVILVPLLLVGVVHPRRVDQLRIQFGERLFEGHILRFLGFPAASEIVEERIRLGVNAVFVVAEVPQRRRPLAVRSLVLTHQQERFRFVARLHPVDAEIGDEIGDVAGVGFLFAFADHRRVVIDPLPRQDVPVIETGRIRHKVPLADDRRLITGLLEQLGKGDLGAVELAIAVVVEAVDVRILAREHAGPARPADAIRHQAAVEAHPLFGDAVDIRGRVQLQRMPVGADRLIRVIVRENEDDVRRLRLGGGCDRSRDCKSDADETDTHGWSPKCRVS